MSIVRTYTYTKTKNGANNNGSSTETTETEAAVAVAHERVAALTSAVSVVEGKVLDVPFAEKDACKQLGGR